MVFPELFLSGYELGDPEPLAVELDGPGARRAVRRGAQRRTAVVVGAAERTAGGTANSAICIDSGGEVAAVYRKAHPFGAERDVYIYGDEPSPLSSAGA